MLNKKYLIIVEGSRDEINVFSKIFSKYGYKIATSSIDFKKMDEISFETLTKDNVDIVIAKSNQSRIHDLVIKFDNKIEDIEKFFNFESNHFQGIFLVFDVDHNDKDDLEKMYNQFNSEDSGLLLVSSPSLEVYGDPNYNKDREDKFSNISKEYKGKLNLYYQSKYKCNVREFIANNFGSLSINYLKKNTEEFNERNILEHPGLVIRRINELNVRHNYFINDVKYTECIYRYYTTVIYVMIAHIEGLTREIDNYQITLDFFTNNANSKK